MSWGRLQTSHRVASDLRTAVAMLRSFSNWLSQTDAIVWWLSAGSLAFLLISPPLVAWLITRLPTDHFVQKHRRALDSWDDYPTLRIIMLVAKCAIGIALLLMGVIMLVAPGQGLLTIVVGLMLLEFPGKFRIQKWIVTRRQVWRSMNWLRKRAGQPEFEPPK